MATPASQTSSQPEGSTSKKESSVDTNTQKLDNNKSSNATDDIIYKVYSGETELPAMISLIERDLSEPYSIYTYRYFLNNWPDLSFIAYVNTPNEGQKCVGVIISKLGPSRRGINRGYIAMLAVHKEYRHRKIGSQLVIKTAKAMELQGAEEVVLETEITNKAALALYENLGFIKDKRLHRYYMNGVDAFRLKLFLNVESDLDNSIQTLDQLSLDAPPQEQQPGQNNNPPVDEKK